MFSRWVLIHQQVLSALQWSLARSSQQCAFTKKKKKIKKAVDQSAEGKNPNPHSEGVWTVGEGRRVLLGGSSGTAGCIKIKKKGKALTSCGKEMSCSPAGPATPHPTDSLTHWESLSCHSLCRHMERFPNIITHTHETRV